ncbi:hypothetical protein J0H58_31720 [bacterium]|nr:hypothetical protein [bacterium]
MIVDDRKPQAPSADPREPGAVAKVGESVPPGEVAKTPQPRVPEPKPQIAAPTPPPAPSSAVPLPVAPPPRLANPLYPPPGWASGWKEVGQVKARVAAVVYTPAPLVNAKGEFSISPSPCALVWLEFENAGPLPREVRRYQPSAECVLAGADGPLGGALFGVRSLEDPTTYNQTMLGNGDRAFGLLAFVASESPTAPLTLTLDAVRVGERGRFVFTIPPAAWRR